MLIGAKPRDPEFGCLCANGPVALDTRCVFYTRDQVPPPEVCTGAIMCCVPELPMVAADVDGPTEGRAIDMEALRERPLATLLARSRRLPPRARPRRRLLPAGAIFSAATSGATTTSSTSAARLSHGWAWWRVPTAASASSSPQWR